MDHEERMPARTPDELAAQLEYFAENLQHSSLPIVTAAQLAAAENDYLERDVMVSWSTVCDHFDEAREDEFQEACQGCRDAGHNLWNVDFFVPPIDPGDLDGRCIGSLLEVELSAPQYAAQDPRWRLVAAEGWLELFYAIQDVPHDVIQRSDKGETVLGTYPLEQAIHEAMKVEMYNRFDEVTRESEFCYATWRPHKGED